MKWESYGLKKLGVAEVKPIVTRGILIDLLLIWV